VEWQEDADELKKLYQAKKDHQDRTRLQALWFLRQGRTGGVVAELVGKHPRTIQDWIAWYGQGGVAEVLRHRDGRHTGSASRLTTEQGNDLKALAEKGELRTVGDGVQWDKEQGVTHTYWGMRHVFQRLKLEKMVPRPRNPKASAREQEARKKGGSVPNRQPSVARTATVCTGVTKCALA
jgi:transposase